MTEAIVQRVKAERDELAARIQALEDFIRNKADAVVSAAHKDMLHWQLHVMKLYHHVLNMRLTELRKPDGLSTEHKTTRVASEKEVGIDEPVEVGGHDIDRDGPIPFDG